MRTFDLTVVNRAIVLNDEDNKIIRTTIGVDEVHVYFDNSEWLEFPVTISFGNGPTLITDHVSLSPVLDSEWKAECTALIPWEVMQNVGKLRITLQGSDSSGNHIITAYGAPLQIEASGDNDNGDIPSDAPTPSEWRKAYNDAMEALDEMAIALASLSNLVTFDDLATINKHGLVKPDGTTVTINEQGVISSAGQYELPIATTTRLGGVKPDGTTIVAAADGTLNATYELKPASQITLGGILIGDGLNVMPDGRVSVPSVPVATDSTVGLVKPDNDTVTVDEDGTIHSVGGSETQITATSFTVVSASWTQQANHWEMPITTLDVTAYSMIDLKLTVAVCQAMQDNSVHAMWVENYLAEGQDYPKLIAVCDDPRGMGNITIPCSITEVSV